MTQWFPIFFFMDMKLFVNLDDAQERYEFMEAQRRIREEIEKRWENNLGIKLSNENCNFKPSKEIFGFHLS